MTRNTVWFVVRKIQFVKCISTNILLLILWYVMSNQKLFRRAFEEISICSLHICLFYHNMLFPMSIACPQPKKLNMVIILYHEHTTSIGCLQKMNINWSPKKEVFVCVPMPTHCTIMRFRFCTGQINGVNCGLFFNHAPLGQTTLRVGWVSV